MSLTTISGPGGAISLPSGFNAKIAAWNATIVVDTVDDSGFVDAGYHTHQPTAEMITGSAMGTGGSGVAGPVPAAVFSSTTPTITSWKGSVTLTAASGCTLAFNASFTSVALGRVFNGKLDTMYTFVSDGEITMVWS